MAFCITKSMLTRLSQVKYDYPGTSNTSNYESEDQWHKIFSQSASGIELAKEMICRICAKSACTPLAERFTDGYDIMSAIRSSVNIGISMDDSLPKYICSECLETLKIVFSFKKKCEAADRNFRRVLNPLGDPSLHSYPYSKHDFHLILHRMNLKKQKREEQKAWLLHKMQKQEEKFNKLSNPKEKLLKCSPCDMTFPDKTSLIEHRRERQCMRRACDICGQLVLSISQHLRHIHKNDSPHKCPTCGKEFPVVARLKAHMLVHTNTFNFYCDLCPYKCKHKYYLVMHMRTHTGEKPYKCAHCPATFVNSSNLNKHKLIHQEKQFKCPLCDKLFRKKPALREHYEAAHMNIKHRCDYCRRDFTYRADLRKHEIKYHNRIKRDYIGGEPAYKKVERLQNCQEVLPEETWQPQHVTQEMVPVEQTQFAVTEENKEFIYFTEVPAVMQQPVEMSIPPTVTIFTQIPMKKDEVKMYEQPELGYF